MKQIIKAMALLVFCTAFGANAESEDRWIAVERGPWEPKPQTIERIKNEIRPYVQARSKAQGRELREWTSYTFQYQGQENAGRPFVFVNALCRVDQGWRLNKQMVMVKDGGPCYFTLKYDIKTREFFELMINGEA